MYIKASLQKFKIFIKSSLSSRDWKVHLKQIILSIKHKTPKRMIKPAKDLWFS